MSAETGADSGVKIMQENHETIPAYKWAGANNCGSWKQTELK